ncbi:MAG TPA: hypothetical protein VIT45_00680 [Allosphingosinicella sp.]
MRIAIRAVAALSVLLPAMALAQASPEAAAEAAAVAAACGGDMTPAQMAAMPKAKVAARLSCFNREAAVRFNRKLPMNVDPQTILERVSTEGTLLTYHYKVDVLTADVPAASLETVKTSVRAKVCNAADMRNIISAGGSYRYLWNDRAGAQLAELVVSSC